MKDKNKDCAGWLADKICNGGDYSKEAAIVLVQQALEIERLRAVVDAAQEWSADRSVRDWGDADLLKALCTFNGDNTEPCPECDGECGEPCAPCTVAEAHASIDRALDDLVKRGKLYRGEPIAGLTPNAELTEQGGA